MWSICELEDNRTLFVWHSQGSEVCQRSALNSCASEVLLYWSWLLKHARALFKAVIFPVWALVTQHECLNFDRMRRRTTWNVSSEDSPCVSSSMLWTGSTRKSDVEGSQFNSPNQLGGSRTGQKLKLLCRSTHKASISIFLINTDKFSWEGEEFREGSTGINHGTSSNIMWPIEHMPVSHLSVKINLKSP